VPDLTGVVLDLPDDDRLPFIWARIAKKNGLPMDLGAAVEMARETLGMDARPASAM
jgi:hypothetical protein